MFALREAKHPGWGAGGDMATESGAVPATSRLANKVVLVTGGSSGIGRAIALACARAGADVALTYRKNADGAEATAADVRTLKRQAEVFELDLRKDSSVQALPALLQRAFGRVDVWVNNAGADILTEEFGGRSRIDRLDLVLDVDLRGTVLAS